MQSSVLQGILIPFFGTALRVLKPGGIFCGCFYVKGENRRTDWFVEKIYTPKGYFTPPYETAHSLEMSLGCIFGMVRCLAPGLMTG